ncbi:UNVERIFIED_CONTAM: hypothetical protein NCL1_42500 [Trichonephila clavipes]
MGIEFDIGAGPSGYPNIRYPTFEPSDFQHLIESEKAETNTTQIETVITTTNKTVKKSNIFSFAPLKKLFGRKKKEQRQLEWALKDSAIMYAAKFIKYKQIYAYNK